MKSIGLTRELGDSWDRVVENCSFHDTHHHAHYHQAMVTRGEPVLVHSADGAGPPWAFPIILRPVSEVLPGESGFDAFGVYGYSGIAWSPDRATEYDWSSIWEVIGSVLRDLGVVSVFIRWHPQDEYTWDMPDGAEMHDAGRLVLLDLTLDEEQYFKELRKGHRYDIRRAKRDGLMVDATLTAQHLDEFYDLYTKTMDRVGAEESYYFDLDRLRALYESDRFEVLTLRALVDGVTQAASTFLVHPPFAHYFLSGSIEASAHGSRPSKLVIHAARNRLATLGVHVFNLGGGVGGTNDSLYTFKHGFSPWQKRFRMLKWVVDNDSYQRFSKRVGVSGQEHRLDWFPRYRLRAR